MRPGADYDLVTDDGRRWTYDVDDGGYWRSEDPNYPGIPDWSLEITLKLHHGAREIPRGQHIRGGTVTGPFPPDTRVRHIESGRLGTVLRVMNGPDALDMDDTIDVVEWDDVLPGEEWLADPELRAIAYSLEETP